MHIPPAGTIETESARIATLAVTGAGRETGIETVAPVETTVVTMTIGSTGGSATNTMTVDAEAETDATTASLGTRADARRHLLPRRGSPHQT